MIALEKVGLPTVAVVARGFEEDFEASAVAFGFPQLPYVVVPYTMTSRNREEAAKDVEGVFDGLSRALATQPPQPDRSSDGKVLPAERERFEGADLLKGWEEFNRDFLERGLGDGFPLVAPTPQLVEAFLRAVRREPLEVVGYLAPGNGAATVERLAINAAMAGCEPTHLPVLIAAVEAITQTPQSVFPVRSIAMSTGPHAMMLLVNGPIVKELGINSGLCTLGPGKPGQVNTALGRALRLILMNVGHSYPGEGDMDTIGSPLKYSMCIGENEEENPWEPFHVERG
ncbi:MAG: UGSC family (seleno)protein, partial [Dehalococcoidia bacterium]|nr:UGSC family (seleno)protein [Dehalococcoidia bacterium]